MVNYWVKYPKWHRKFRFYPGYERLYSWWRQRYARKYAPVVGRAVDLLWHLGCPFTRVEIETLNRCQNDCDFCPVNHERDTRPLAYMPDILYSAIINELRDMKYKGGLYISSNNEPLMDSRIVQRIREAKEKCPDAKTVIYTNGLLLKPEHRPMMKYLDSMMLDNYNDALTLLPPIRAFLEPLEQWEADKITLLMRYKHDVLDTRGGQSDTRPHKPTISCSCTNPFSELVITPTGETPLCCQDVFCKHPMGNVGLSSISEVWHGARFQEVRKSILAKCRDNGLQICRECDFIRSTPVVDEDLKTYHAVRQEGLPP